MATKLTPKQARFLLEYAKDHNGTQAAIRAGYGEAGASVAASRLLKDPRISAAMDAKVAKVLSSLEISVDRVLTERARLAFFDPRKLFTAEGTPIPINELDDDTAAAISGLEVVQQQTMEVGADGEMVAAPTVTKKYRIVDKNAALTALEKHLGIGKDDNTPGVLNIIMNLG